jgi:hypothetical protein
MRHSSCVCLPSVSLPPHASLPSPSTHSRLRPFARSPPSAVSQPPPTPPLQTAPLFPRDLPAPSSQHHMPPPPCFLPRDPLSPGSSPSSARRLASSPSFAAFHGCAGASPPPPSVVVAAPSPTRRCHFPRLRRCQRPPTGRLSKRHPRTNATVNVVPLTLAIIAGRHRPSSAQLPPPILTVLCLPLLLQSLTCYTSPPPCP